METYNPNTQATEEDSRIAWILIIIFAIILGLSLIAGIRTLSVLIFPIGAISLGLFLYFRFPHLYIGFTWWLWFVGPCIRRLIDFRSGTLTPGDFILTPGLVSWISAITLIRYLPKYYDKQALPFILCISSIFYGFLVGIIQGNPLNSNIYGIIEILGPILFSFHISVNSIHYLKYRKTILNVFLWGLICMGLYGILQRLNLPPWDEFYLLNIEKSQEILQGSDSNFGLFSTTEGRQQFAGFLFPGLILLLCQKGTPVTFISTGLGYLNLLLSRARAGWLSWLVTLLVFLPSLKSRLQIRVILLMSVSAIIVVPLSMIEPFSGFISERLDSLSSISGDASLSTRQTAYNLLFGKALIEVVGKGIGFDLRNLAQISTFDGAILPMMFWLGWIGLVFFVGGLYLLFWKMFEGKISQTDNFAKASRAIAIGLFIQIGFNLIFVASLAMVFWGFLGIAIAANSHHENTKKDLLLNFN